MTLGVYILLDRSSSMADKWEETISSLNHYVADLKKNKTRGSVTVACFDSYGQQTFDILRDSQAVSQWSPLKKEEVSPRGMTPLYDSVGKIIAIANEKNRKKTVLVILTDGAENSSKEVNKDAAKKMIKQFQDREWQVVFLGADFDAMRDASSIGVGYAQTMSMTAGNYTDVTRNLAAKTMAYTASGTVMDFNDDDRAMAVGAGKKKKTLSTSTV